MHIEKLTKIQERAIPHALGYKSLVVTSQTGSGKTLCYLLPLLNRLNFNEHKIQGVIVLPTKELARQINSKLSEFKPFQHNLRTLLVIGNQDIKLQVHSIKANPPQIIVGTVTRVLDLIKNHTINHNINTLVLDEVDMLIDLGFNKQVNEMFELVDSPDLIKFACSATTHYSLAQHLRHYLGNTKVINIDQSIWSNESITHHLVYSTGTFDMFATLQGLLKNINPYMCIIFANTKNIANDLYQKLLNHNVNVALLHKDLSIRQRKNIYREINKGHYQYLVATDLAARGLDINGVDVVISYGLPEDDIWYMHRIGRTGRVNAKGVAYTIYENGIDHRILRLSRKHIVWHYLFLNKEGALVEKPLKLHLQHKPRLDETTNRQIKMIIGTNSKKIRPGYKKKIRKQIHKIKQRKRHEFIEKKIKQHLLIKNIRASKHKGHK